jgi:hypothetical protein
MERRFALATLLATSLLIWWAPSITTAGVASALLLFFPGFALGLSLRLTDAEPAARLTLAAALGLVGSLLLPLLHAILPLALSAQSLYTLLTLLGAFLALRIPSPPPAKLNRSWETLLLFLFICISLGMRLLHLGAAEFQGDEARAMFLASGFVAGDHSILFLHRKGPAEALLASAPLLIKGQVSEGSARFIFALAGALLPLFAYTLTRRIAGATSRIALIAAALVSVDGFLFAFSRIVQYQTPLVLFVAASFLAASLIRSRSIAPLGATVLAALFMAAALLCHYDSLFAAPALALYVVALLRERFTTHAQIIRILCLASVVFLFITAAFYLPFLLHEQFGGTAGYLSQRLGLHKLPVHNISRYFGLLVFYGGGYSALILYAAGLGGTLWWTFGVRGRSGAAVALLGALILIVTSATSLHPAQSRTLAAAGAFGLCVLVAPLLSSRASPLYQRVLVLWVVVPLAVLGFLFARPNTHFYVLHLPLAIIAAVAFGALLRKAPRLICALGAAIFALSITLSGWYLATAYLTPRIEYRFVAPRVLPWFAKPFFARGITQGPFFGFQRRSGWKAVSVLYSSQALAGSYGSNEEELVTSWYLWPTPRTQSAPQNFMIAVRPNDPVRVSSSLLKSSYNFWGRVYVDDHRSLDIYRSTPSTMPPHPLDLAQFITEFDSRHAVFPDARAALAQAPSR